MKVAVCAIGKWEEQYLPEWVEHYKNIGFDNIIFYDNNDPDDNGQYEVLKPYIDSGFVIYRDYRTKQHLSAQKKAYKHSNMKYAYKYDYIAYFDVDEFLELVGYKTIKEFINKNKKLKKFDGIVFNWKLVGDGGLVYNDGRTLKDRFSQGQIVNSEIFKSMVKKTCKYTFGDGVHSVHSPFFYNDKAFCTTSGEEISNDACSQSEIHYDDKAYIKHYRTKTIQETVVRTKRGYCNGGGYVDDPTNMNIRVDFFLNQFCSINELTQEKLDVVIKEFPQFKYSKYYGKYKKILEVNKKYRSAISKSKCSGCSACENICPTNAIELKVDNLTGFKLAEIDVDKCIGCGKCKSVCPHNIVNMHDLLEQKKYALKSLDEDVLKKSSSGGAFTHITKPLLERGWKIVGVKWNKEWHAEYDIADTIEEWEAFRKSKYMQSDMGDLFPKIKKMLDRGDKIVFVGIPCHVSGLLNFLGKEYDNLLTIDLLCNSMVSPKIWDLWYEYEGLDKSTFTNIDMRPKIGLSCTNLSVQIEKNNGNIHNIYMQSTPIWGLTFGGHLTTLDICGNCKYKSYERVSDITIGDLWNGKNIVPELWDNKESNLSSCMINTKKAKDVFNDIKNTTKVEIDEIKLPPNYEPKKFADNFYKIDKMGLSNYIDSIQKLKKCEYDIALCGGTLNYNFGATLTYYALYKYLEELGKKVIIIPPKAGADKNNSHIGNVFEKHCNIAPNYFAAGKPIKFNELSNIFLIGSDQTWRTSYVINKWKMTPWLDYVKHNKKKLTYSVCYGTTNLEKAIETAPQYVDEMKRLISNFDYISHRTQESCDITKNICGKDSVHTIDPVFIVDSKEYDKLIDESTIKLPEKEYACFYTLRAKPDMHDFFHKLSQETNCDEIIIGNGDRNAAKQKEQYPNEKFVNPILAQDWLKYIKNAKYVVTDSFHGICFCILFNKPFISIINDKDIRINWILGATNLRDHYLKKLNIDKAIKIINRSVNHLHHLNEFIDYSKKWINEKI